MSVGTKSAPIPFKTPNLSELSVTGEGGGEGEGEGRKTSRFTEQ